MLKELSTLSIVGLNSPQREFQLDSRTSGEGPSVNAEEFRQGIVSECLSTFPSIIKLT
jgi:hypothetical protein